MVQLSLERAVGVKEKRTTFVGFTSSLRLRVGGSRGSVTMIEVVVSLIR